LPQYKGKGCKQVVNNYRPISLLSPVSKVFESLIASRIYDFCESNSIFSHFQFGFRQKLSCESALNTLVDDWKLSLDNRKNVISVFLDLRKAFDTVDHTLLLYKLKLYGFSESLLLLLTNYLSNRSFMVQLNGARSDKNSITMGVPQGSILGPLLFILYINDLCLLKLRSKLALFADDTTVYFSGDSISYIASILTDDLNEICTWFEHNRLIINWKKTNAMLFSRYSSSTVSSNIDLKIRDNHLSFVDTFKLLGVLLDRELNFDDHVSSVCKKVNQKCAIITRNAYLFSPKFKEILLKSFVLTHFDYCSTLFTFIKQSSLIKLEKCFAKSLKQVLGIKISHLNLDKQLLVLKPFKIFPLHLRLFRHYCVFLYSLIRNDKAVLLLSKLTKLEGITLRNPYLIPGFNLGVGKFSFSRVAPKLLNSFLNNYLKLNLNSNSFTSSFDTNILNLFNTYFYPFFK